MIRFTSSHPCPICPGHPDLARGQGRRCAGFLSDDGAWAHCERDAHAGGLQLDTRTEPPTYLHRLDAACRCGTEHGVALAPLQPSTPTTRRIVRTYPYQDAEGRVVYRQVRFEPKGFAPQHPTGDGGWQFGLNGVPRVLYRLPELIREPKRPAFICEGEKDVDRLVELGLIATTNCGGSPSWRKHATEYAETFRGRPRVVVLVDNDDPGRHWAREVAASIAAVGTKVSVLELPDLPDAGDVSDWLDRGHTVEELKTLATAAPAWSTTSSEPVATIPPADLLSHRSLMSQPEWPDSLSPAALHGLAGDVVRAIDPHTESDPAAVLASFLTAFGNVVGPDAHVVVGSTQHTARIFTALVGETARARKGDSWTAVRRLMVAATPDWADGAIQGGLSSGEGLISAVRDSVIQPDRKTGVPTVIDAGVLDKRLLVVEPELARTLRVMRRDGSTLSSILRDAWDSGSLRVMTMSQLRATGAHLSAVGHITVEELRRELDDTSFGNGFANRFLWLAVKRSKALAEPEPFAGPEVDALAQRISRSIAFARNSLVVERDEDAREVWRAVYPQLTADRPGMLGAILNRCEAHAVRLSLIYALLDRSPVIKRVHLEAALAVLDYVEASARFIFANRLGDPIADTILATVQRRGQMTRTDVRDLFGRHESSSRTDAAIAALAAGGSITVREQSTGGRPTTVLELAGASA